MTWKNYEADLENNILMKVKEGMQVYDSDNHQIGKVDDVFLGSVTPKDEDAGEGPATEGVPPAGNENPDNYTPNFAFGGGVNPTNYTPDESWTEHERLLREGYMHVDTGDLFERDRIVLPQQIAGVNDVVHLKVPENKLLKA